MPVLNTYRLGGLTPTKTEHTKSKGREVDPYKGNGGKGVRKYNKKRVGQIQKKEDEKGCHRIKGSEKNGTNTIIFRHKMYVQAHVRFFMIDCIIKTLPKLPPLYG